MSGMDTPLRQIFGADSRRGGKHPGFPTGLLPKCSDIAFRVLVGNIAVASGITNLCSLASRQSCRQECQVSARQEYWLYGV